ncbi:MAG: ribosome maturation factor RimM [Cyclobacteriaceae bacterium]
MSYDNYFELGNVVKTHGLKGELILLLDVDQPDHYKKLESIFLEINGKLVPFFIQEISLRGDQARLTIEDINSQDAAKELVGKRAFLPLSALPKLKKGQYYYHDLIGCQVFEQEKLIGIVLEIIEAPNNMLMSVDHQGKEILIPMEEEIMLSVDLEQSRIQTSLPDGLLDVYLDP